MLLSTMPWNLLAAVSRLRETARQGGVLDSRIEAFQGDVIVGADRTTDGTMRDISSTERGPRSSVGRWARDNISPFRGWPILWVLLPST
jgi:hypothetical protein